jgi:hypothetical protein
MLGVTATSNLAPVAYGISYGPNPVKDKLVINGLKNSDQWDCVELYDMNGHKKL